ncbi:MAG: DUF3783 domain-containing protein [Coprobacillus sp.]
MKEVVLVYHLDLKIKEAIEKIMSQLDVDVKEILDDDVHQSIGYLLGISGYEESEEMFEGKLEKEFVFFAGFSDEQLDLVLEIFKAAEIPYIPYKAMLTPDNVVYPFYRLYQNVEEEYKQISRQS